MSSSEKIIKRSGNVEGRMNAGKNFMRIGDLKSEYTLCLDKLEKVEDELLVEKNKQHRIGVSLEDAREKLAKLQEVIDADPYPEGAQPRNRIQQRDMNALNVGQIEAAMNAQKQVTEKLFAEVTRAEKKVFEADKTLVGYIKTLEDAQLALTLQRDLDKERSKRMIKLEEQRAKRWEAEQKQAIDARTNQLHDLNHAATQQVKVAKEEHKKASKKLQDSNKITTEIVEQLKEAKEKFLGERTEVVLEMKANQNAARVEVATQAAKYVKKLEDAKKELDDEKESMLAKGLNPYIEFRKRDLNAEARSREKRMVDAVEENKVLLAERLVKEEDDKQRALAEKHRLEHYEKLGRSEQGRAVVEKRNMKYITTVTTAKTELLDPSGRGARTDPSQIVDIPDYSIGLGKSVRIPNDNRKRIIEQIRQNLGMDEKDFGEYERLVRGLLPHPIGGNDPKATLGATSKSKKGGDDLDDLAKERHPNIPGTTLAASTINLGNDASKKNELLQLVSEQSGSQVKISDEGGEAKKYEIRTITKFEQDSLERNKQEQRDRIEKGVEQIAAGKLFKGDSFVSKPAELIYKDFEVGKVYKKSFTMTNASYTFNSFKLVDLPDSVIDFFLITYERPGRVSAGVSCALEITFSPQLNRDIDTKLKFLTETGPVEVPLRCLIKRCAPKLVVNRFDFGNAIIGQQMALPLKIKNTQALGSKFTVNRVGKLFDDGSSGIEDSSSSEHKQPETNDASPSLESEVGPAANEGELTARVQRVMTKVFRDKKKADPVPISFPVAEGYVSGYGEATVQIRYAPLEVGLVEEHFAVTFEGVDENLGRDWGKLTVDENNEPILKEQHLSVHAIADLMPIYVAEETMNMITTLHGRIYRKRLELRNRGKISYRINISIPPALRKYVEVNPDVLFVQPQAAQLVNVKFTPLGSLLTDVSQFTVPFEKFLDAALAMIPIELQVVNQELPVYFILKSDVTSPILSLSTTVLNFGSIYLFQNSILPLTVTNRSMLPQKVAFVRLRKEVSVEPNEGFYVLLPNETFTFNIAFSPIATLNYEFNVELMTSTNEKYLIQVKALGVESPFTLSSNVLSLRTTCAGERVQESVIVKNTSNSRKLLEIKMPDLRYSWVKISPFVLDLAAGASARVEIEFTPPANIRERDPSDWKKEVDAQVKDATPFFTEFANNSGGWIIAKSIFGDIQWTIPSDKAAHEDKNKGPEVDATAVADAAEGDQLPGTLPDDEWGIAGVWNFPIFIKSKSTPSNNAAESVSTNSPLPFYLRVETAVTLPQIDASTKMIDFGQMALGTRQIKTFKIFNRGYQPISLFTMPLNAVGPFTMLNYVRSIEPGSSFTVIIECLPVRPGLNVEILELFSAAEVGGHRIRVTIRVQGVKPVIELAGLSKPPSNWNPRCGILDFGGVVATDRAVKQFSITNKSSFTVETSIIRSVAAGLPPSKQSEVIDRTVSGLPIFSYRPERVKIAPGSTQNIEVIFRPDRERFIPYREDLEIIVGKTDETLRVGLFGRSWMRQLFVTTGNPADESFNQPQNSISTPLEDACLDHPSQEVRKMSLENMSLFNTVPVPKPAIKLEFPDPFSETADPASFVEITSDAPTGKAAKGAPVVTASAGARKQSRILVMNSAKFFDNRQAPAGTYEVILNAAAIKSGLFTVAPDKGPLAVGAATNVEFVCTLPKPKGLGGLAVGSWQSFSATVVQKGGWVPQGEKDERQIPVELRVFVSL